MNREEFLQFVLKDLPPQELQRLAQGGEALFQAAMRAANDGNHLYDYLGESGEHIAKAAEALLKKRQS